MFVISLVMYILNVLIIFHDQFFNPNNQTKGRKKTSLHAQGFKIPFIKIL